MHAEAADFWAVVLFALAVFGGNGFSAGGGGLILRCRWWVCCGQFLEEGRSSAGGGSALGRAEGKLQGIAAAGQGVPSYNRMA